MRDSLTPLIQLQRLFIPVLLLLLLWAAWRTVVRRDFATGLALYLSLVIVVDCFLNTGIYIPGLDKGSIRYSECCAVVLFCIRPSAPPRRPPYDAVQRLVYCYFLLLGLSVFRSQSVVSALFEFRTDIIPQLVAFTVARRGLRSSEDFRRFLLWLMALTLFVALFDFWDLFFDRWILKSDMLDKPIYAHTRQLNRFGSIFLNPNYLGAFIVLVFPATFIWTLNERRPWQRTCARLGVLFMIFCLVETQSRGALLAFGITIALLMLGPCGGVSRKRRVGMLAVCCVVFLAVMPGFINRAVERFDRMQTETVEGRSRETTWRYAIRIIGDHPLLGIGFGEDQFTETMIDYGFESEFGVKALDAPHNAYLQAAVYAGIPALLAFLLANLILLGKAFTSSLDASASEDASMAFGMAVGIVGFLTSTFTDLQLFKPNAAPAYWIFFALLLSLLTTAPQVAASAVAVRPRGAPSIPPRSNGQPPLPMPSATRERGASS
jgi:O-antigen ligase